MHPLATNQVEKFYCQPLGQDIIFLVIFNRVRYHNFNRIFSTSRILNIRVNSLNWLSRHLSTSIMSSEESQPLMFTGKLTSLTLILQTEVEPCGTGGQLAVEF